MMRPRNMAIGSFEPDNDQFLHEIGVQFILIQKIAEFIKHILGSRSASAVAA